MKLEKNILHFQSTSIEKKPLYQNFIIIKTVRPTN